MKRIAKLSSQKAALAKLAFVGLQQRLLSSIAAFARRLKTHRVTLQKVLDGEEDARATGAATAFVAAPTPEDSAEQALEEEDVEKAMASDEEAEAATASAAGVVDATLENLRAELSMSTRCSRWRKSTLRGLTRV